MRKREIEMFNALAFDDFCICEGWMENAACNTQFDYYYRLN